MRFQTAVAALIGVLPSLTFAAPELPVIELTAGMHRIEAEVVNTQETRMRGLMFRREMEDDHGMIFVFRDPAHQTFWMHNTLIPLDMIFIKPDRTILGIVRNATPETDDPRDVPGDSLYVLEVNGGWCQRNGVNAGDRVELLDVGPAAD